MHANAHRRRKRIKPPEPEVSIEGLDPVGDLLSEHFGTDFGRHGEGAEDVR